MLRNEDIGVTAARRFLGEARKALDYDTLRQAIRSMKKALAAERTPLASIGTDREELQALREKMRTRRESLNWLRWLRSVRPSAYEIDHLLSALKLAGLSLEEAGSSEKELEGFRQTIKMNAVREALRNFRQDRIFEQLEWFRQKMKEAGATTSDVGLTESELGIHRFFLA